MMDLGIEEMTETAIVVLTTPEATTPMLRRRVPHRVLAELSVRGLIHRLVGPETSVLPGEEESEHPAIAGIRELLAAECCEVWVWREGEGCLVSLDAPALISVGGKVEEVKLDLRPAVDNRPPESGERRKTAERQPSGLASPKPLAPEESEPRPGELLEQETRAQEAVMREGYLRKVDLLRARFQPEVEVLDFRGLFVGNKGMGILGEPKRRELAQVDPAQVADLLLRGNGLRRSGNHVKALMCYQELVELDPGNKDFRFLLERTYQEIAGGGGDKG